ncbi:hypothetical protein EPO17_02340 [Patescibacteria group bacterium]|nr:MAG: hypothetical protein EPO17_02340 [Patescibacteria group bacterium]
MTQSEFDAELAEGKRSWPNTHVPGDLDVSGLVIVGDVSFEKTQVDGDLDLSGTIIHGNLTLCGISITGSLNLTDLCVKGELYAMEPENPDPIIRYGLDSVLGQVFDEGLTANDLLVEIR